jgi:hypothetical protein
MQVGYKRQSDPNLSHSNKAYKSKIYLRNICTSNIQKNISQTEILTKQKDKDCGSISV